MSRFARSWSLFKTSLGVVKADKELLWMPVLSGLSALVVVAAIAGVGVFAAGWPNTANADGSTNVPGILLAGVLYVALAFITLFFNAAVVAGASERLAGGDPTLGSCLRAAARKAGRLFVWSIAVATVNVVLQMLRERSGVAGKLVSSFAGLAWNLATYLMVPTLMFEDKGMGASMQRSAGLFKQTWGETVIAQGGLGILSFLVMIPLALGVFLLVSMGSALSPAVLIAGFVTLGLAFLLVTALMSVLEGVYKAALYRYATTGQAGAGFTPEQLGGAFATKGR